MIENSSKAPFNFSPLECTYLGKNSFQYHKRLIRKNEIEKWLLRTSVQCICITIKLARIWPLCGIPVILDVMVIYLLPKEN